MASTITTRPTRVSVSVWAEWAKRVTHAPRPFSDLLCFPICFIPPVVQYFWQSTASYLPTLLSPPQSHTAFGTVPHTLASVDHSLFAGLGRYPLHHDDVQVLVLEGFCYVRDSTLSEVRTACGIKQMRTHNRSESGSDAWVDLWAHPTHTDTDAYKSVCHIKATSEWMNSQNEIFIGYSKSWSRGRSVSIVAGYGLDDRAIKVRSPAEARGCFL
jgi:hypothetical protein